MPTGRRWLSAAALDSKIYVVGGFRNLGSPELPIMEVYDPQTNTWTRKADMPTPKKGLASCTLDGKLYVVGMTPSSNKTALEVYDPGTDSWTVKPDMPGTQRAMVGASVLNGDPAPLKHSSTCELPLRTPHN